jgi:hypothetical protein
VWVWELLPGVDVYTPKLRRHTERGDVECDRNKCFRVCGTGKHIRHRRLAHHSPWSTVHVTALSLSDPPMRLRVREWVVGRVLWANWRESNVHSVPSGQLLSDWQRATDSLRQLVDQRCQFDERWRLQGTHVPSADRICVRTI